MQQLFIFRPSEELKSSLPRSGRDALGVVSGIPVIKEEFDFGIKIKGVQDRGAHYRDFCISEDDNSVVLVRVPLEESALSVHGGSIEAKQRRRVRQIRDENFQHVVSFDALKLVNKSDGIFSILNPEKIPLVLRFSGESERQLMGETGQMMWLVELLTEVIHHPDIPDLERLARQSRNDVIAVREETEEDLTVGAFNIFSAKVTEIRKRLFERSFRKLSHFLDIQPSTDETHESIIERCLQLEWLDLRLNGKSTSRLTGSPLDLEVTGLYVRSILIRDEALVIEGLDRMIEDKFNALQNLGDPMVLSMGFTKSPYLGGIFGPRLEELDRAHKNYQYLSDLRYALFSGQKSAVGGNAYAEIRFPRQTLNSVAAGRVKALVVDGDHEDAITEARIRLGGGNHIPAATIINLPGMYGSFKRSLVVCGDESILVISGFGLSRQLSNAASLLCFSDRKDRRVPLENIVLLKDPIPSKERLRASFQKLEIPRDKKLNHLLILQHPKQFATQLGVRLHSIEEPNLGVIHLAEYGEHRFIISSVGSSGAYGSTAGELLEVFLESDLNKSLDIWFTGTAGAFAKDDFEVIGKIATPKGLVSIDGEEFLVTSKVDSKLEGVFYYERHFTAPAPACETDKYIEDLVGRGFSLVEVELGHLVKAASKYPGVSVNPLYICSDDPRASKHDAALGIQQIFHEGSKPRPELYRMVIEGLGLRLNH
mgnify:CR=1 FL=1